MGGTDDGPSMRAGTAGILLFLIVLALAGPAAQAQMTTEDVIDTGPRDEAVTDALAWERLQTDIKYLRPDTDFRPGEGIEIRVPDKPDDPEQQREANRLSSGLIAVLLIVVVLAALAIFGNQINVSFGRTSEARRRARTGGEEEQRLVAEAELPRDGILEHLAGMADRRRALILLTGLALDRAARMNGLTLARAQTARDVLRILPRGWHHLGAIRQLVREAEVVHFGGRDLGEETWQACLTAARPLFAGQEAPG